MPCKSEWRGQEERDEGRDVGSVGYYTDWSVVFLVGLEEFCEPVGYTFAKSEIVSLCDGHMRGGRRETYASLLSISLGKASPGNRLRPSKDPKPRSTSPSWVFTGSLWGLAMISAVYQSAPPSLVGHTSLALDKDEDQISVNPSLANLSETKEASCRPWSFNGVSFWPCIIPATLLGAISRVRC